MSVPSWAHVGAKVVCIDARWNKGQTSPLRDKAVYTVAAVLTPQLGRFDGRTAFASAVELLEAVNPTRRIGFNVCRFRPVHTLRGDVRAIKSMLRELPAETRLDRLLEALDE